ncbi:hypothetical protein, partial [uncultured Aeromonas sp.]|uniref:hypothetical protein n=1 Tax=uncultured Aeromonas sp. TaxID=263763 RepID=UPI00259A359A
IRHARVGHCQAPNTRNPAHRAGFFIGWNSENRLIIKLFPYCHSMAAPWNGHMRSQRDLFVCSIFARWFNGLDIKNTECDASTFLVMPPLV